MAVVALKSTAVTNATATPVVANSCNVVRGNLRESQGFANIGSGDSATSTYRLFRIRSSDRASLIRIYAPDIGTTTTADLGLYDKNDVASGAVVDADFFASAVVLNAGAVNGSDLTFEAAAAGGAIANAEKSASTTAPLATSFLNGSVPVDKIGPGFKLGLSPAPQFLSTSAS